MIFSAMLFIVHDLIMGLVNIYSTSWIKILLLFIYSIKYKLQLNCIIPGDHHVGSYIMSISNNKFINFLMVPLNHDSIYIVQHDYGWFQFNYKFWDDSL